MSTGLLLWVAFFALWLFAVYRATHRAFPVIEVGSIRSSSDISFSPGPIFAPAIVFHLGLGTVLCVTLLSIAWQDLPMMWFCLPGACAPTFQGAYMEYERLSNDGTRQVRRIPSYWLREQWPFVLLGVSIGVTGATWAWVWGSLFPLLLIAFSVFFLFEFWFFFSHYNGVVITPTRLSYQRSFPRWRSYSYDRRRSKDLTIEMRRRGRRIYDVRIEDREETPIELKAKLSPSQRLQLELEEYDIRNEPD
ncbi:MAG: hypothetical protein CME26_09595 [Gemmatimonadetes bacterium]|nr:hypothetical protein [Gemmatimonadota bacterium]|tara:strand:- start:1078 stop:1824 length:747 start_codon:yes stop_codon:yes gene_type:complete